MNTRPHSITVISWLFIAAGLVGLAYHATEFKAQRPFDYGVVWVLLIRLLAILCGVFMLLGSNWARWLLLIWIAYHVILSAFHSLSGLVIHSLLFAVVAYFLCRSQASAYFRTARKGNPLFVFIILAVQGIGTPSARPHSAPQSGQAEEKVKSPEADSQQQRAFRRLILKDGTYQLVSKYEINGNLVRYLSSERHEWEEVPYSLVDWPATERYAKETAVQRQARITQSAEADAKELAEEEAKTPLVSPGIRLPDTGGVFLLDTFEGKPELNELYQNGASINKNTAGNILRGVVNPIATTKRIIELAGLHAQVQSHVAAPVIYVALGSGDDSPTEPSAEAAKGHYRIVRCEEKNGNRIVGVVNIAIYGKVKQDATYVEVKLEPISASWVKITPATSMPPGEYALVEVLGKEGINTFVWDFGVNASAPENRNARKGDPVRAETPPVLQKRQKPAKP
jgi:hypothetical protein